MRTIKIFIVFCIFVALFCKGCLHAVFHQDYVCADSENLYIGVPEYRFKSNALEFNFIKATKANIPMNSFGRYDMCFVQKPIYRWNREETEIIDSVNLLIVSHTPRMSYLRDSIFPHVVKGAVYLHGNTFYIYDSITICRLFEPNGKNWYLHSIENTSYVGYAVIQGGMEEEYDFYLSETDDIRRLQEEIVHHKLSFYFMCNEDFESQTGLHVQEEVDTAQIQISSISPLFPTKDMSMDYGESQRELYAFMLENMRPPLDTITPRVVRLNMVVERDGRISSVELFSRTDSDYWAEEALRIAKMFPPFMPAHIRGVAVKTRRMVTFDFPKLAEDYLKDN